MPSASSAARFSRRATSTNDRSSTVLTVTPRSRLVLSRRLAPEPLQIRLDERVQVSVHHALNIAHLHLGAVIVHHGVRLEDIRADLIAPGIVGLGGLDDGASSLLLLQLFLIDS